MVRVLVDLKRYRPQLPTLLVTPSAKDMAEGDGKPFFDKILPMPLDGDQLKATIDACLEPLREVSHGEEEPPLLLYDEGRAIIGQSPAIRQLFSLVHKLSRVETSVLIRGESGTGKELVARALHYNSIRKNGPFVAVNCGAMPENLIESELFWP